MHFDFETLKVEGFAIIYAFSILETRGPKAREEDEATSMRGYNSKSIFTLCPMMSQRFFSCTLTNILATLYAKKKPSPSNF